MRSSSLSRSAEADFRAHAVDAYPEEACGVVVDGAYRPCANRAEDPTWDFRIAAEDLLDRPSHVLHSHSLSGLDYPSLADQLGQQRWGNTWGLVRCDGTATGELVQWGPEAPIPPYEGRTWKHFVRDCASLICDWYEIERGVRIRNVPRTEKWLEEQPDLWLRSLPEEGFERIEAPEVGGLMLCSWGLSRGRGRLPFHAAVVVNESEILHHPQGMQVSQSRLSRRDPLHGWTRWAHSYWRLAR